MDVDYSQEYYQDGYREGLLAGSQSGFDEGYALGVEEGSKLGRELGLIISRIYQLLSKKCINLSPAVLGKIYRLWQDVFSYPLANFEDPEKEVCLLRIRGAYRELCALLGAEAAQNLILQPVAHYSDTNPGKAKFDF